MSIYSSLRRCTLRESPSLTLCNERTTSSQIFTMMPGHLRGAKSTEDAGRGHSRYNHVDACDEADSDVGAVAIILGKDRTYGSAVISTPSDRTQWRILVLVKTTPCCSHIYLLHSDHTNYRSQNTIKKCNSNSRPFFALE